MAEEQIEMLIPRLDLLDWDKTLQWRTKTDGMQRVCEHGAEMVSLEVSCQAEVLSMVLRSCTAFSSSVHATTWLSISDASFSTDTGENPSCAMFMKKSTWLWAACSSLWTIRLFTKTCLQHMNVNCNFVQHQEHDLSCTRLFSKSCLYFRCGTKQSVGHHPFPSHTRIAADFHYHGSLWVNGACKRACLHVYSKLVSSVFN